MIDYDQLIHKLCNQGFYIIDGFLEPSQCQSLRAMAKELYEQGLFRGAKIGLKLESHKNNVIRTDEIFWLDEIGTNPAIHVFLERMQQLAQILNQSLFWVYMNLKLTSPHINPVLITQNISTNSLRKKHEKFHVCII
ncbi:hypothetical protein FOLKNPGA_03032 [Legionella sp. PC1000]|nr:hypothetical protein FOLKNPGA_03032 [Legionella sp. PC1000]